MGFAAFKFQLSSLTKVLENPLVLAWKQADKWHRSRVKEALPLPLIVVQRLEAAVLGEPGEDRLLLCAILAMVWGSLRWSDVQRIALDSVVLDGGALWAGAGEPSPACGGWRGPSFPQACVAGSGRSFSMRQYASCEELVLSTISYLTVAGFHSAIVGCWAAFVVVW